jgi:UDP-N-acetylmuramoyl-tripeptide--D-alanyl-D-alanine ligase
VQPDIGVVLNVRSDHYSGFHGLEHTQAEKAKLITQLPASGTAVLNCDDPLVWAMRERTPARVVGFGLRAEADFRAENVRCAWPDRLSFDLVQGGRRYSVQTNLIGQHVAGSALAALVVATRMGIPIDIAIARLGTLTHTPRRMAPVSLDSGVTFVRDDFKATSDSMPEVLRFLADARASRKIAVVGRISDYPGRSRRVYTAFAKAAAMVVDILVFVGDRPTELWGTHCRRSEESLAELRSAKARVHVFSTVRDASAYLHEEVRSGDLMLLKGSGPSDHLERIFLQHQKNVRCWRTKCGRTIACDACDLLETVPNEEAASSCARC